jgi:predicted acyl esterase
MDTTTRTVLGTVRKNLRRRVRADITVLPPPQHVRLDRDVEIVVRDGTRLRANVFRPEVDGAFPVLLSAATYGKDRMPTATRSGYEKPLQYRLAANDAPISFSAWTALEAPDPAFWVPRGYVVVNLDLRGWGSSEGDAEPFGPHEGRDVHDAIEWAGVQPWSNGKVGMTGVSYLAISQWAAAATRPPHLAAINPWEGFTDPYRDFAYPGGIRENGFLRVWSAWQRSMRPTSPSFRANQKRHPLRDAWWQDRSPCIEDIDVPALVCATFSDQNLHSRGSFEGYRRLGSTQKWLYTHRAPKWSTYYGREALAAQTRFFDHFLRGDDTGISGSARVRIEVREERHVVAAVYVDTRWPPTRIRPLELHLDAATGRLGTIAPVSPCTTGRLAPVQFRWRFDEETDVVGPMRLRVPISTSRGDLNLFAGIRKYSRGHEVVFEGSYGFTEDIVTRGWLRAALRAVDPDRDTEWEAFHPFTATEPVTPGEAFDLDLTLLPSATRFAAGDELVLELRDRYFFAAPPLLGQFPAVYARTRRQAWRVHTGGAAAASLTIPVWDRTASSTDSL